MFRRSCIVLLGVLALSGCKDSAGVDDDGPGVVKFTYAGQLSGTFNASGIVPAAGGAEFGAATLSPNGGLTIVATDDDGTRYGNTILLRASPKEGSVTCAPGSVRDTCTIRAEAQFSLPADAAATANGYVGTLNVTTLTATRTRGTFSFELPSNIYQAGTGVAGTLRVVNGTFDVPIVPSNALNGVLYQPIRP